MCGIAGLFDRRATATRQIEDLAAAMSAPLRHRGPDDAGTWADEAAGIALGFRRLAILDLSPAGHQPMLSPSGRFVCVFNGEVYNHGELRTELRARGVRFRGHSDTEVIVAAVEAWGVEAAVRRFIGMFAIALWDRQERVLHLIRDRMGIKPLFVYAASGRVAFASELKSILALPGIDRTIDRESVLAYLRRLYVPTPRSVFKQVRKLLPGHILTVRSPEASLPDSVPYWALTDQALAGGSDRLTDERAALDQLDTVLRAAVRQRMIADVPLGAFLSGGIDSSLVVALMQESSGRRVRTFSVGFDDPEHNEAPHAAAIAAHLGTEHTESMLTAADALAIVPDLPEYFDEPFADPSAIPNFLVCRMAKRDATVALSGLGGDELFGGYNRYTQLERAVRLLSLPRFARRSAGRALALVPPSAWQQTQGVLGRVSPRAAQLRLPADKARKLSRLLMHDSPEAIYESLMSAWHTPADLMPGVVEPAAAAENHLADSRRIPGLLDRAMLSDQAGYLVDDQLVIADRTSMSTSLEVRVPLLDHRAVELSWRLPTAMKIRHGVGKWCLRELLARRVPRALFERPKVGFSVPLDNWLRGPLREWAGDLLSPDRIRRGAMLNPHTVQQSWRAFEAGRTTASIEIWTLLMLEAWRDRWDTAASPLELAPVQSR